MRALVTVALSAIVILTLRQAHGNGAPPYALAADAPPPALLVGTAQFLIYAEGDRRQPAVAGPDAVGYRVLETVSGGNVLVSFDEGSGTAVEIVTPALQSRTVKLLPRGTSIYRANDGFLAYDPSSQLVRRYDAGGTLIGTPVAALGAASLLGVGDMVVALGGGRLRVWESRGRLHRETNLEGNSLTPLPDNRFAVIDARDGEVRAYDTDLNQTATLRYQGLPIRALASAPDGALAVLAGTPACVTSNAEVDVFTDLHAQPAVRIHDGIGSTSVIAIGADGVYAVNAPCRSGEDGSINAYGRDGTKRAVMRNVGIPTSLIPFRRSSS